MVIGFKGGSIIIPSINGFERVDGFWVTDFNNEPNG
jgi:hypothetical protein